MNQGAWNPPGSPEPKGDACALFLWNRMQAIIYYSEDDSPCLIYLDENKTPQWQFIDIRARPKSILPGRMLELLQQYSPRVYFHEDELYLPSSLSFAFEHMQRELRDTDKGRFYCLTTKRPFVIRLFQRWLSGDLSTAVVYAFFVEKSGRDTDLTYFFFYPYDQGLMDTDNHVSDWEHVTIRLRWNKKDGDWVDPTPVMVAGSAHNGTNYVSWADVEKTDGTRPVIYAACGTHDNYFTNGPHRHHWAVPDFCGNKKVWDTWKQTVKGYHWDPTNPDLAFGIAYKGTALVDGDTWPVWMSTKYEDPGSGDPARPEAGPIYRWGNAPSPADFIGDGITGPIDKDEVWQPWAFG